MHNNRTFDTNVCFEFYIGLNMVRAGAVNHPAEWGACGYHELTGRRQRYRIVDVPLLLNCLGMPCYHGAVPMQLS